MTATRLRYRSEQMAVPSYRVDATFPGGWFDSVEIGRVYRTGSLPSMQRWNGRCADCIASQSWLSTRGRAAELLAEHYAEMHLKPTPACKRRAAWLST
jgi:hypothetical protein